MEPDAGSAQRMRWLPWVSTPIVLVLVITAWQLAVSVFGVSEFILPTPAAVGDAVLRLLGEPTTWGHIGITMAEVTIGFLVALVTGVVVGVVLGRTEWLERALRPVLVAIQVVPKVAFIPLFVIWFGFGVTSKIIMAATLAFFPIMLNVMLGVRSVDRGHRDVMLGLGAKRWPTFRDLELPSTLPYVFAGMEVAVVFSVIGAIVGEYLGGSEGLGYMVVVSLNALDAPQLFAVILLLAVLGCLLYLVVNGAKRFVIPWHESVLGRETA
jgi:NitT/TauT family transport system permease protein